MGMTFLTVIVVLAIVQSTLMTLHTWETRRYSRNRIREMARYAPRGRVEVFAPCKGVDLELADNLRAVLTQTHPDYRVTFIVERIEDPAYAVLRQLMKEYPASRTRLVVAGLASDTGQKVHNLRVATEQLDPCVDYLAFIDSDARPRPEWLQVLVSDLERRNVGATTGYRWFIPARNSLANLIAYSVNCNAALWMGRGGWHLPWGGSWAIRRELFQELDIRGVWERTLSDDLAVSRVMLQRRLKVLFHPPCVVHTPVDYGLASMFGFLRRQYLLARVYVLPFWLVGLAGSVVHGLGWLTCAGWIAAQWASGQSVLLPAALGGTLYAMGVIRSWLRQDVAQTYFPELAARLRWPRAFDLWCAPLANLVNMAGMLAATVGNTLRWRGICYRVGRDGRLAEIDSRVLPARGRPTPPDTASSAWRKAG